MKTIHPKELYDIAQKDPVHVIDVRTPAEFNEMHAAIAHLVPLDSLDPHKVMEERDTGPLYVFCQSGNRAAKACEKFNRSGYSDVIVVDGGVKNWEQSGLPVVRGKKAMSLERQVRIGAGSLVLLGAVLALAVHPAFLAVPAFVGAGLIFAGVTDWCGMAMVLAKMPWNQGGGSTDQTTCSAG